MKKRLLSFVLAVLMIASLLPATALAANIVDSGTCGAEGDGSNLTWTLDSEGVLTISGTGAIKNYFWNDAAPWKNQGVKRAVITSGVTHIGTLAFYGCTDMTDITIPDSVTEIYIDAFSFCSSLTSVVIPDSVTRIDREAFYYCDSLTNITLPDSITYIADNVFGGCYSLTGVVIPDSVTSIGDGAFAKCKSLTNVTIPDSVTSIGDRAFSYCSSLTGVVIPDSVTSIGDCAFAGCASLTDIAVSEGSPYFCSQEGVVYSKDKKTIIAYPAGRESTTYAIAEGVTDIAGAFGGCTSLTAISIPESVTGIGSYAFSECTNLMEITIPEHVTSIGDSAFWDCAKLESLAIPDCVTSIGAGAFRGCESLKSIAVPNGVTIIAERTFDGCKSLESITIPDTVTAVEGWAFNECNSLKDIYYLDEEYAWLEVRIESEFDGNDVMWRKGVVHCFSKWTIETEPTCTEPGSETSVCSVKDCDKTFTRTVPALGHAWDDGVVTKPATETETGVKTFTCTRCGETRTETMPVIPHVHSYKDVVTAPTCTEKGYTTHTCACGDSYVDTYTDALGHAWDEGKVTKEATETTQGSMTYTCTRCPATKRDILPASGLVATAVYNNVKNDTSWFYPGVQYCLSYGLMSGMGNGSFAPGEYTTRAQAAQILYNLHGNPEVSGGTPFTDVPEGAWYQKAVTWAHSVGIVNGVTATTFSPNANITRQDFVLMLMRYLNNVRMVDRTWKPDDLSRFADAGSVGFWALDAMKDAVAINAISGVPVDGHLYIQPARNATRAEAAKILMMFHEAMTK